MRNLLLVATIALMSVGCANMQFGDNNLARARIGGGARFALADAIADGDGRNGDATNLIGGGVQVGTVVYDDENFQADIGVGPEFFGTVGPDKEGTSFGVGTDLRVFHKTTENLNPFVSVGAGLGYTDVQFMHDGGGGDGKWNSPFRFGAGLRYRISESFAATAEYNLYHFTGLGDDLFDHGRTSHGTNSDVFLIGVEYNF